MNNYKHKEAFCLMQYECVECGTTEVIWNSRDAISPFMIDCQVCTGNAKHVRWNEDKCVPSYKPPPRSRIFTDLTFDRAMWILQATNTHDLKKAKLKKVAKDMVAQFGGHNPDVVIVPWPTQDTAK